MSGETQGAEVSVRLIGPDAAPGGGACQAGTRATKPHAVDTAGSPAVVDFNYDCNGNVTTRVTPAPTAGAV